MTINHSYRKVVIILLSLCLMFALNGISHGQAVSDIKGHWAESQLNSWLDQGFIKGYPDGSVKPDSPITRAEFMVLVNKSFGFTNMTDVNYTDVKKTDWFYNQVAIATQAGYIKGYSDGTAGSEKPISRQEVAVVVNKLLKLQPTENKELMNFKDVGIIPAWSKDSIGTLVIRNIMQGNTQNMFKPLNPITRAETVVTLNRAIQDKTGIYDTAGIYGVKSGTETFTGDISVNVQGVTLQNMVITGNLLLGKGIGSGDATLKNVTVKGTTTVSGGGVNSIHVNDSTLGEVVVDKEGSKVRIVAEGSTTVNNVTVNTPVTIEENGTTGSGFGNVTLSDKLPAGSDVTLDGTFEDLKVLGKGINIDIPTGSVGTVTVDSNATGVNLDLNKDVKVTKLEINAVLKVTGSGTIQSVDAKVEGSTFVTAPQNIVNPTPAPTYTPPIVVTPPVITPPVAPAPLVENATLKIDNGLVLNFSINEAIDLGTIANIKVSYFTKNTSGNLTPISNTLNGNNPLIKDKTWDGYLWGVDTSVNYSKGAANTASYVNVIPANTKLATLVHQGYHSPATNMNYTNIDWTQPATYVVQIEVTNDAGNVSQVKEVEALVTPKISNIKLVSNGADATRATVGDTVTLTFKTTQEVSKLGNFKINGSNPTTFEIIGSGNDWTTTATYTIEQSDPNGLVLFQINVKTVTGETYSTTIEQTSDGSAVEVYKSDTVLSTPTLTVYTPNKDIRWNGYAANTVFQANVNFTSGTSSNFRSAQISLYHGTTLLATNTSKAVLLASHVAGLTDLFGIGDSAEPLLDTNWDIGAYTSSESPTRAVFTLVGNDNVVHIIEATFTP